MNPKETSETSKFRIIRNHANAGVDPINLRKGKPTWYLTKRLRKYHALVLSNENRNLTISITIWSNYFCIFFFDENGNDPIHPHIFGIFPSHPLMEMPRMRHVTSLESLLSTIKNHSSMFSDEVVLHMILCMNKGIMIFVIHFAGKMEKKVAMLKLWGTIRKSPSWWWVWKGHRTWMIVCPGKFYQIPTVGVKYYW